MTTTYSVRVWTDYPESAGQIQVPGETSLVDFLEVAADALDCKEDVRKYDAICITYGLNPIAWGTTDKSQKLSDVASRDKCTVLLCAPPDIKPQKKRLTKEEREAKKKQKKRGKTLRQKYAGIDENNALVKLEGKHTPTEEKLLNEYIGKEKK